MHSLGELYILLWSGVLPMEQISILTRVRRHFHSSLRLGILGYIKLVRADTPITDRLSGLWGAQTPLGLWLQENEITTLFFGGVNADQCVWGTLLDAYYKGFDVIYVDDLAATVSPTYATQMVRYNADLNGFLGNSTEIIQALS